MIERRRRVSGDRARRRGALRPRGPRGRGRADDLSRRARRRRAVQASGRPARDRRSRSPPRGRPLTYFRAAMVIGPGSESYELLRGIVETAAGDAGPGLARDRDPADRRARGRRLSARGARAAGDRRAARSRSAGRRWSPTSSWSTRWRRRSDAGRRGGSGLVRDRAAGDGRRRRRRGHPGDARGRGRDQPRAGDADRGHRPERRGAVSSPAKRPRRGPRRGRRRARPRREPQRHARRSSSRPRRERVWDTVMDPTLLERWVTTHDSVTGVASGPVAEGDDVQPEAAARRQVVRGRLAGRRGRSRRGWRAGRVTDRRGRRARVSLPARAAEDGGTRFEYRERVRASRRGAGQARRGPARGRPGDPRGRRSLERLRALLEG